MKLPSWLLAAYRAISLLSCTLLLMYLTDNLECNTFVRMTLVLQVLLLLAAAAASWRGGA